MGRDEQCVPLFSDPAQADDCAARLRVIADETRLRIILALQAGEMAVWQLAESLDEDAQELAEHLELLHAGRMVQRDPQANYSLRRGLLQSSEGLATIDLGCCRVTIPTDL